jgi:hypothetical protein
MKTATSTLGKTLAAILVVLLLGPMAAHANDRNDGHWEQLGAAGLWWMTDPIEGVWDAKVIITTCTTPAITLTTFDALGIFARGGTFHDTNSTNPVVRSSTFGTWRHIKGRTYQFAFKFFRFDTAGIHQGTQIVRHDVVLARDGKSYTSEGTSETYDTAGILIRTGCSNATATRFK